MTPPAFQPVPLDRKTAAFFKPSIIRWREANRAYRRGGAVVWGSSVVSDKAAFKKLHVFCRR
jgi:hypothetical protein